MGLLSIIRKQKLKEREVRVLMLGLDAAGKTTIVRRLLGKDTGEIAPTVGFNIDTLAYNGFNVNVWDIGGQQSLRTFWYNYFERTDFLVWVVDASSLQRLRENFKELANVLAEERLAQCGLVILINKIDTFAGDRQQLEGAVKSALRLDELQRSWKLLCVSAFTGENLDAAMDWITTSYAETYYV